MQGYIACSNVYNSSFDKMDKTYIDKKEEEDFKKLTKLNEDILHLNSLGKTPQYHHTDASGLTKDGRVINIELKQRTFDMDKYNTLYIDDYKACNMLMDFVALNLIPIYVNFMADDTIIVFNLLRLHKRPKITKNRTYSKGKQAYEYSDRQELYIEDEYIYKKDKNNRYRLIKKSGESKDILKSYK